jgi:elongation factor P--beta-lysine ligase
MPEKWHGLQNIELRYRQRYLDLMSNVESMRIAKLRSVLVKELRNFFDAKGFYEVETPILQPLYGGANAKPFVTHHNALDMRLYLRVAPELYLKRLIVGGFEKVYEIARCFRNEGIDHNHNPEFTQIEYYWAYADYNDSMKLVEEMLPHLITKVGLPLKFKTDEGEVDFTPPYPRKTMRALIQEFAKMDIEDYPDQESIYKKAKDLGVEIESFDGRGKIIDEIYKKFARPNIINPIFVTDHPVELSPLAKRKSDDPRYTERFQLLCVIGHELSHVKNFDTRLMGVVSILAGSIVILSDFFMRSMLWGGIGGRDDRDRNSNSNGIFIIIGLVAAVLAPIAATLIQLAISRRREYLADADGALLTRYPEGLARALEKIAGDRNVLKHASNATAHLYIENPFKADSKKTSSFLTGLFSTHPPIEERIKLLRSM